MKEDKYTKKLCQESGLCHTSYARYSEKRLTQIYNWFCMETPWLCPFEGHKYIYGCWKPTETSVFEFSY